MIEKRVVRLTDTSTMLFVYKQDGGNDGTSWHQNKAGVFKFTHGNLFIAFRVTGYR